MLLTWLFVCIVPPLVWSHDVLFNPLEATISSTHQSIYGGFSTCRQVVSAFLSRIEELNHFTNAIIALDADALIIADEYDERLRSSNASLGALFCIPIMLKDNFDTANLPTTSGSLALAASQPSTDALTVQALKRSGAIILGKTNLHELALEGLTISSLGGQTINPYDYTRTPGGSSGGTGAAVAASFAVWGTGTDTVNSLRSPANANGLVSCRPTKGLISRTGIVPNSRTQDVAGPIARCVEDVAVALTVMASVGSDPVDEATASVPHGIHGTDYASNLASGNLRGLRFGVLRNFLNITASSETTPVNDAFTHMTLELEAAGATIVEINDRAYDSKRILSRLDTQQFELGEIMGFYLQNSKLNGRHPLTLEEIFASGDFLVIPHQYGLIGKMLNSSTTSKTNGNHRTYQGIQQGIEQLKQILEYTLVTLSLDALLYPQQMNLPVHLGAPSQSGRNGILAAVTGSPVVAIPIGYSPATETAPEGVPIGMEILGRPWTEEKLLQIAYQIQELGPARRIPRWAATNVPVKQYAEVPKIVPDRENIHPAYPLGRLSASSEFES